MNDGAAPVRRRVVKRVARPIPPRPPQEPTDTGWDGGTIYFRKDGKPLMGEYRWTTSLDGIEEEVNDCGEPMEIVCLTVFVADREELLIKPSWWGD